MSATHPRRDKRVITLTGDWAAPPAFEVTALGSSFQTVASRARSTSNSTDSMQFNTSDFANWTALQSHVSQSGANTSITFNASNTVTLTDVTATNLTAS